MRRHAMPEHEHQRRQLLRYIALGIILAPLAWASIVSLLIIGEAIFG